MPVDGAGARCLRSAAEPGWQLCVCRLLCLPGPVCSPQRRGTVQGDCSRKAAPVSPAGGPARAGSGGHGFAYALLT